MLSTGDRRPAARQPRNREPSEQALAQQRARAEKRAAEEALGRLLRRQTELEAQRVTLWGGDDYGAVGLQVERADALFAEARFAAARDPMTRRWPRSMSWRQASPNAWRLRCPRVRRRSRWATVRARPRQFAIALSIDPDERRGSARSERARIASTRCSSTSTTALEHETKQELELARAEFARRSSWTPRCLPAGQGLERVTDKINAVEFRRSMSEALSAIDDQDFESARRALDKASEHPTRCHRGRRREAAVEQSLRGGADSAPCRDGRETTSRPSFGNRRTAEYTAVLAIDTSLHFAQRGARRTGELAALQKEMDKFLASQFAVYDPNAVKHVQSLLDQAAKPVSRGPYPSREHAALCRGCWTLAKTPIAVSLASDNQTMSIVYKVGELGRFTDAEH